MHEHSAELFLSVVTVAEIESGIAKSAREGATRKAADLRDWLALLLHLYAERVLAFDIATAEHAGGLADFARAKGQAPGFADIVIAATARRHGLTILSRNLRHFAPLGVPVIDPFEALP
jgi:predicted nucleic acid-binding protein